LRVSEACGIDIDDLGIERSHRTGTVLLGKGSKLALIPLPPRMARACAVDLAAGERLSGPLLLLSRVCGQPSWRYSDFATLADTEEGGDHEVDFSALFKALVCHSRFGLWGAAA
jgi:hypothetical protein